MKYYLSLFFCLFSIHTVQADPCYLLVEDSANFSPKIIQSTSISLFNKFITKVKPPPISGLKPKDCVYSISVNESMQGFMVSISGDKINNIGYSKIPGLNGLTHSILKAIYNQKNETIRNKICSQYEQLMKDDCKPISVTILLFGNQGKKLEEGSHVKEGQQFNIFIQPDVTLHCYIINKDSTNHIYPIFPNKLVSQIGNPLKANLRYYFPPMNSSQIFSFDKNIGEETFYFVFSPTPIDDLDYLFTKKNKKDLSSNKVDTMIKDAIRSRGLALTSKEVPLTSGSEDRYKLEIGDYLKNDGAFVKTITFKHIAK